MSSTHNVFISHRHEDDELIKSLKNLLRGKGVEIRNASVTSDTPNEAYNPDYIKSRILYPRIRWAGKVIVLITTETKNHEWVDWEIEYANRLDKPIIGVWAHGEAGCELPKPLERHADAVIGWNGDRIIRALEGERLFENPDGSQRGPQPIDRIGC